MEKNKIIEHVSKSLLQAETLNSKLDRRILNISGMSSPKIRHFLNNLMEFSDVNYMEIGLHHGSTFISSLYKNDLKNPIGIDIKVQKELLDNCKTFNLCNHEIIEQDCWNFNLAHIQNKINVFLYDGDHTYETQYKALQYYYPVLDDVFVFLVDDWTFRTEQDYYVERGTRDSIRDLNLETLFEEVKMSVGNDASNWWNGYFVSVLKKSI